MSVETCASLARRSRRAGRDEPTRVSKSTLLSLVQVRKARNAAFQDLIATA